MGTSNKNLVLAANGATGWDATLNANFAQLDAALGGVQAINVTGNLTTPIVLTSTFPIVTTPLTSMSYLPQRINVSGNIGLITKIAVPVGVSGTWVVSNNTNGAYALTFGGMGGGTSVTVIAGATMLIFCDGTDAVTPAGVGLPTVGDYKFSASSSAQAGWLLCYGQAVSRTTYGALYAAIGTTYGAGDGVTTFNVPDNRGCALVGADNMGGAAAGRLTGYALGTLGGEQNHTLTVSEMAVHSHSAVDNGHAHGVNDPGHHHSVNGWSSGGLGNTGGVYNPAAVVSTSTEVTGISIQSGSANISVSNAGSGTPHNNIQPSRGANLFIYAGV